MAKSAPQYLNLGSILFNNPSLLIRTPVVNVLAKEIEPALDRLEITYSLHSHRLTDDLLSEEDLAGAPARSWTAARFDAVVPVRGLASRCLAHCSAPANDSRRIRFGLSCCRSRDCFAAV